jgi:hypothetical protein
MLEFGLAGADADEHRTLWGVYAQPFVNCVTLLRPLRAARPAVLPLPAVVRRK